MGSFSVCAPPPPRLVGAYYLHSPDARAIFLRSDLSCNGACSVTVRSITYWGGGGGRGGHKRKSFRFKVAAEIFDKFDKFDTTNLEKTALKCMIYQYTAIRTLRRFLWRRKTTPSINLLLISGFCN